MKIKTLKIFGSKTTKTSCLHGPKEIYPAETKRIVAEYFLFPKTIDNETRRGLQCVEQIAQIKSNIDETRYFNQWKNLRFVEGSQLEQLGL